MILILSNKFDITTDFVVRELQHCNHSYTRINTEDLPEISVTTSLPDDSMVVEMKDRRFDITKDIGVIWNRRPRKAFEFSEMESEFHEGTLEFIRDQWSEWLASLESVSNITWVNAPWKNRRIEAKITQLRLADELGFSIPRTIVTNSNSEVTDMFWDEGDGVVAKALGEPIIRTEVENEDQFVYSVRLDEPPSSDDQSTGLSPTIFQEPLLPKVDFRVTVIGEAVFPVEILGTDGNEVPVDWRTELEDIRFIQSELPEHIEELCRTYVSECGLRFGAIDLVKVDGEFVFLEINPNGEWGWLEKPWGVPIAEELAAYLIENDCTV